MYITVITDLGPLVEPTLPTTVNPPLVADALLTVNVGAVAIKFPDRTIYARVTMPPTGNLISDHDTTHSLFAPREAQEQVDGQYGQPWSASLMWHPSGFVVNG
jgi:hypothetical protein